MSQAVSKKLVLIVGAILVSAALAGGVLFIINSSPEDKEPVEQAQDTESKQEHGRTEDKTVKQDGHASTQPAPKHASKPHAPKKPSSPLTKSSLDEVGMV